MYTILGVEPTTKQQDENSIYEIPLKSKRSDQERQTKKREDTRILQEFSYDWQLT